MSAPRLPVFCASCGTSISRLGTGARIEWPLTVLHRGRKWFASQEVRSRYDRPGYALTSERNVGSSFPAYHDVEL